MRIIVLIIILMVIPMAVATELIFDVQQTDFDLLTLGGGYNNGGITLFGSGSNIGSGFYARDILLDGDIMSVTDVNITGNFVCDVDGSCSVGNGSNRFGSANFSGTVQAARFVGDGSLLLNIDRWNQSGDNLYPSRITSKLGIGTTTPGAKLEVKSSADGDFFNLVVSDGGVFSFRQWQTGGSKDLAFDGAAGEIYRIYESDQNIHFSAKGEFGGTGVQGSPDAILDVHGDGSNDVLIISSDTTDANAGDYLIVKNGGNVGIGTTTPEAKLDVNTTDTNKYAAIFRNSNAVTQQHGVQIQSYGSGAGAFLLDIQGDSDTAQTPVSPNSPFAEK